MILVGITVCVDFEDYLEETLHYNRPHFDSFMVVTYQSGPRLRQVCDANQTTIIETNRFFEDGARFNKGKAINDALRTVENNAWVLHLDADIVLPKAFRSDLDKLSLDPEILFGCARLLCPSYAAWKRFERSGLYCCGWEEQPPFRYVPSFRQLWEEEESQPRSSRSLPLGFFQLFSRSASCLQVTPLYPEVYSDAGSSDLDFALKWKNVLFLDDVKVIHLPSGEHAIDTNWEGRRTLPFPQVEAQTVIVDSLAPALRKSLPGRNGLFLSCYHNGGKAEEGMFSCGLANDLWSEWYENGQLEANGHYEKGVPCGLWSRFSAEGQVVAELRYRKGRLDGEFKVYHRSGLRKAIGRYHQGRLDGVIQEWYANGAQAFRGTYRSGRKHGSFLAWHQNGAAALAASYRNDYLHGSYRIAYESGQPMVEGTYWHGARHGWFVSWHDNGQKASQVKFCNGRQIGHSAFWPILDSFEARLVPGKKYQWLEVAEKVSVSNARSQADEFFARTQERRQVNRIVEPYVVRVPNGYVGFEGVTFDEKRLLLIDPIFRESFNLLCQTSRGFRFSKDGRQVRVPALIDIRWPKNWSNRPIHRHPRHKQTATPDQPPFIQSFAKLVTIVHRCSASYYHYLLESVPRLLQIRDRLDADRDLSLLIDYDFGGSFSNTWIDQYLRLLGVDLARVVKYDPSCIYFAEELYLPGPVFAGRPQAAALQAIRAALLHSRAQDKGSLVVAVNRSNAACRRIVNWREVVTATRESGELEVVDFNSDECDVAYQIELFSRASMIVGAHGAGLANTVFCNPGTIVIEIVPAQENRGRCFQQQAALLGLQHSYLEGSVSGLNDDFNLPVERFLSFFKSKIRMVHEKPESLRQIGTR